MIFTFSNPRIHFYQILFLFTSVFSVITADDFPTNSYVSHFSVGTRAFFGVFFIFVGLFLVFYGESFLNVVLFVTGAILFFVLGFILSRFIEGDLELVSELKRISICVVCLIFALIGGFFALYCYEIGLLVLGGLLGFSLANIIVSTNVVSSSTGELVLILVFVVTFSLLTYFYSFHFIAITTPFIGAIITFYGIDMFALTGFSDYVFSLKKGGDPTPNSPRLMTMIGSLIVLAVIGIIVQFFPKRR